MPDIRWVLAWICSIFASVVFLPACGNGKGKEAEMDASTFMDAESDAAPDAQIDSGNPWDPRFDPFVTALQTDLAQSNAYGVSAAVMENGVVTFARAFGSKDPEGVEPLTPDTLMQIGSTTKQMTATALLRKVESQATTLDATLEAALPLFDFALNPAWDDAISVRSLLTHQGGFYDYVPWDGGSDDALLAEHTYGEYGDHYFVMNPPGIFWNYSNPNFVLAGLLTEVLDTRPWPDLMRQDVFLPLGMTRTFLRKTEVEADGDYALSYGYGTDDITSSFPSEGPVDMEHMPDPAWARPAGLVWTTPSQMMVWAAFLMDGNPSVLSDALREELSKEQVDTLYFVGNMHYGFGLFVSRGYLALDSTWYPMQVWEHGGNTVSFSNIFYVLPEQRFSVAICSSAYTTDFERSLDAALTTLADLPEPQPAPQYVVDPARFHLHVGTYTDPYSVGDLMVTQDGDRLLVEMPTLEQYYEVDPELVPASSEIFYLYINGEPYDLTFVPLVPGGQSEYVRNRLFVTTRVTAVPPPPPRPLPSAERVASVIRAARLTWSELPHVVRRLHRGLRHRRLSPARARRTRSER